MIRRTCDHKTQFCRSLTVPHNEFLLYKYIFPCMHDDIYTNLSLVPVQVMVWRRLSQLEKKENYTKNGLS